MEIMLWRSCLWNAYSIMKLFTSHPINFTLDLNFPLGSVWFSFQFVASSLSVIDLSTLSADDIWGHSLKISTANFLKFMPRWSLIEKTLSNIKYQVSSLTNANYIRITYLVQPTFSGCFFSIPWIWYSRFKIKQWILLFLAQYLWLFADIQLLSFGMSERLKELRKNVTCLIHSTWICHWVWYIQSLISVTTPKHISQSLIF